jgi:Ca-activated chloride channel family protein
MKLGGSLAIACALLVGCGTSATPAPRGAPSPPRSVAPVVVAAAARPPAPPEPIPPEFLPTVAPQAQASVDVTPSRRLVGTAQDEELIVRVRVVGLPLEDAQRPVMNVALVVDTSQSMQGAGIARAREACGTVIDALQPGDVLSIVTFGSQPKLVFEATRISPEARDVARAKVAKMEADGTTDLSGGLRMGIEQAKVLHQPDGINRVVLLGDGSPNDPATVLPLADQARAARVPVTALGLGPEFDETLMAGVAQRSGGTFHFVEDAGHVARLFEQQIARLERVAARNAWVEIIPGPGVTIDGAIGLHGGHAGRALHVPLGDVTEGQVRDVLVGVRVTGKRRDGGAVELLDAVVHHAPPGKAGDLTVRRFASVEASGDAGAVKASTHAEVDRQATVLRVADGVVRAMGMARSGDVLGARKLLDATGKLAKEGSKRFDDADLQAKVKEIAELRRTIASLAPAPAGGGGFGVGSGRGISRPMEASPAAAMNMRKAHGRAMDELQGIH